MQSELFNKIKEHNSLILLDPRFREDDKFREDDENVGLQQPLSIIFAQAKIRQNQNFTPRDFLKNSDFSDTFIFCLQANNQTKVHIVIAKND